MLEGGCELMEIKKSLTVGVIDSDVLGQVLQPSHVAAGLSLEEDGDFISLIGGGKVLARFNAHVATIAEIHKTADQFTNFGMSGVEFGKVENGEGKS
jgi:hypothetical protein